MPQSTSDAEPQPSAAIQAVHVSQQHRNTTPPQLTVSSSPQRGYKGKDRSETGGAIELERREWIRHKVNFLLSSGEKVEGDVVDYDPFSQTVVLFRMYLPQVFYLCWANFLHLKLTNYRRNARPHAGLICTKSYSYI